MEPTLGGGIEPDQADGVWPSPRPAQRVIFSNHGPKPDLVCEISIPRNVGPDQRVSNLTGRLLGLAREILRIFSLFFVSCLLFLEVSRQQCVR